jgi:hypothetical protein
MTAPSDIPKKVRLIELPNEAKASSSASVTGSTLSILREYRTSTPPEGGLPGESGGSEVGVVRGGINLIASSNTVYQPANYALTEFLLS